VAIPAKFENLRDAFARIAPSGCGQARSQGDDGAIPHHYEGSTNNLQVNQAFKC